MDARKLLFSGFLTAALAATGLPALADSGSLTPIPETTLQGTITALVSKYDIHVKDNGSGNVYDVKLHQGTVINPTGLSLEAGMMGTFIGAVQNGALATNEIDTPYPAPPPPPPPPIYSFIQPAYAPYGYDQPAPQQIVLVQPPAAAPAPKPAPNPATLRRTL